MLVGVTYHKFASKVQEVQPTEVNQSITTLTCDLETKLIACVMRVSNSHDLIATRRRNWG